MSTSKFVVKKKIYCPHCDEIAVKNGFHQSTGKQRYWCQDCKRSFIPNDRNFDTESILFDTYYEFLNDAKVKSIKEFADNKGLKRSTLYKHLKLAGQNDVSSIKKLSTALLNLISENISAMVAKETKFKFAQEWFLFVLNGDGHSEDQLLYAFVPSTYDKRHFKFYKTVGGTLEDFGCRSISEITSHVRRYDTDWIAKTAEKIRISKRKFGKVHK